MLPKLKAMVREPRGSAARRFDHVEAFCMFLGYPRSGHSLVGSILDAHPEVAMAHEADVLRLFGHGYYSRNRIFHELWLNARRQAARETGRTQSGYLYEIPGQWQGRATQLKVIGDKSGGESVRYLASAPDALRKFAAFLDLPLRLVHVVRNPYDTVARLSLVTHDDIRKRTLSEAVSLYEVYATVNGALLEDDALDVLTMRHEKFVADPEPGIRRLCEFVGVEPYDEYVKACAGIVWESPKLTRDKIDWPDKELARVQRIIERYSFFDGYTFTGGG